MAINQQVASQILANVDAVATSIENLAKAKKIDARIAADLIHDLDLFSDRFEVKAYGAKNLSARKAALLQSDRDEPYMKTFENPNKVHESDADEEFMHSTGPSFNGKKLETFDDPTSQVSNRDEYAVRDLSPLSDSTKKQPSWSKGPAGKSTKQGSAPARTNPAVRTWSRLEV